MNIEEFYSELVSVQKIVESKGLIGRADGHVNWFGSKLEVRVVAREESSNKDYWRREKSFKGPIISVKGLLEEAASWAYSIPNEEDRVIELMIQKLNQIADELPKGTSEIAMVAWEEIFNMLKKRAESISKNGLPSPVTISSMGKTSEDTKILP